MTEIIVGSTIVGNVIIVLLMLYRGWTGRLQLFAIMTALAVIVEALFFFIHGFIHHLYSPARVFVLYWLFPILEGLCAWEAWLVNVTWLEKLMLIQVGLATVGLFAHLGGDPTAVYRIEYFNCLFNLAGIGYCILRFRGEPLYEPREA